MADTETTTSPASVPAKAVYVAESHYDVQLKRVIEWPAGSGSYYSPRDHHVMLGAVCSEIADGIASAQPV
jgi:hypothetical protein